MLAAIRAVHFAAVLLLFGGFIFVVFVARPTFRDAGSDVQDDELALHRWLLRVATASLVVALVSGGLWLGLESAEMSALSLREAWQRNVVGAVLNETRFGQLCKVRFGIAAVLGVLIVWGRRHAGSRARTMCAIGVLLAGMLLATLALAGHAAAWSDPLGEVGQIAETLRLLAALVWAYGIAPAVLSGDFSVAADVLHLLAAGAWVGALPALVFLLNRSKGATGLAIADAAARHFSGLGVVSVACLIASGLVNSWYLVGGVPGLFGTPYGRLLLLKLGLFAAMLALATANRRRWTPMLRVEPSATNANDARRALRRLKRNAGLEAALGVVIVSTVGLLGTTVPGAHEQPVWPFPFTLDWPQWAEISGLQFVFAAAGVVAAGLLVFGLRRYGVRKPPAIVFGIGVASMVALSLGAVAAFPTTYFHSPVRYTATSIARGNALYAQHCASCHGPYGYGDRDDGAASPSTPLDLTRHLLRHREGDVFWWLSNGITKAMPPFSAAIDEAGRWDLVNFLYAQADAERGKYMNGSIEPWQGVVAPDFTFEIAPGVQQALSQQRGRRSVLLVLFTYPESMPRLCILAKAKDKLQRAGLLLLAVPMNRQRMSPEESTHEPCLRSLMATMPDSDVIEAYTLFRRVPPRSVPPIAPHSEFLIDRQGYLRARWTAPLGYVSDGTDDLLIQVVRMELQRGHPPAPERRPH
jgi:putative copper resistance protein D